MRRRLGLGGRQLSWSAHMRTRAPYPDITFFKKNDLEMMVHVCKPRSGAIEVDSWGSQVARLAWSRSSKPVSVPVSRHKMAITWGMILRFSSNFHTHFHRCAHAALTTHVDTGTEGHNTQHTYTQVQKGTWAAWPPTGRRKELYKMSSGDAHTSCGQTNLGDDRCPPIPSSPLWLHSLLKLMIIDIFTDHRVIWRWPQRREEMVPAVS